MSAQYIFEVAWEVCNRIGGIYTVIKSKASSMQRRWNSSYFLLGPYNPDIAPLEFEECAPPEFISHAAEGLRQQGVKLHFGRWLIESRPQVVLLDYRERFHKLAEDKYFLWKDHDIQIEDNDRQLNDCVVFGFAACDFFAQACAHQPQQKIVVHCHEWMSAVTILRLRERNLPCGTIFTTHATILGRYIASENPQFYSQLSTIDPYAAARHYQIESRFKIERAAAQKSHFFTTISEVTAKETIQFLGRKPDYILPNGINVERFTAWHEFQNLHLKYKERIQEFVMGHFFPSYSFELDRCLYFLISGRYEYRNKGMDVFIEALYRLNQRLKEIYDPPTVVAFIITNASTRSPNVATLQGHSRFEDLKNACSELESNIGKKLLSTLASGRFPEYEDLLPSDFQVRFKRILHARRSKALPAIVTHDMLDDANDPVLQHLRHRHLFNAPSDAVKVVFHPEFLSATSPLISLDYDHFVRGCHLGIFPSSYEPWGYTPLECLALGIPTVTTDLTGFGDFAQRNLQEISSNGLYVLRRAHASSDQTIEELTSYLYQFVQLTRRERIELRNRSERLSESFDWARLAKYYYEVQEVALK